ncbi:MAG: sulfite exporter TauE/SafE family protein [Bacteroidetes bacterium]|nr:sulfite exporter TauE/SafE family protein [Bacteroidota bacterium]MDA1019123.1 sulfite exporter TauE/SafE family protein [Bacteroidota bacterium]
MFEFDQSLWVYALLIFVGFIAGFMNTMAGGGSLLTLPLLIFLGLPAAVANGTNRVAILMSTSSATLGFKSKNVSTYPFNIYLGISGLFGALIGAKLAIEINGDLFNKILAVIMIIVVGLIVFKPKINHNNLIERLTGKHLFISILAFFFIGVYGGFINAGIGFVIMLFLHYYNRLNLVKVNSAKVVIVLIYTIGALVTFALADKVNWTFGLFLASGNFIGGWTSSRWSVKKGEKSIKVFLIVMVVLMSIKLWFFSN